MGENNKGKKKSRRMKERKETTLLTDKFLSLKNIASAVALYLFFFFFCGRGGVPGPMITSCLSTKKLCFQNFLILIPQEERTALYAALVREDPFLNIYFLNIQKPLFFLIAS